MNEWSLTNALTRQDSIDFILDEADPKRKSAMCLIETVTEAGTVASRQVLPTGGGNVTRGSIHEYAAAVRERYRRGGKAEQGRILDAFCQATGYHRKSVVRLLGRQAVQPREPVGGRRRYGADVATALRQIWHASDHLCSKRLVDFLPEFIGALERHGELAVVEGVRGQLLQLSAATIDRLLGPARSSHLRRPWSRSGGSSALKAQIPVRTFGEWAGVKPGRCKPTWWCTAARAGTGSS